jgi:hypothetical protein
MPLESPLQPYECDLPRCDECEWNHLSELIQVMEESGVGPSAAAERYAQQLGLPVPDALDLLVTERKNGRQFSPGESMLEMACSFAEVGVYCTR